jgi:alpha-tubulin suppressor-like RCC1 family protein
MNNLGSKKVDELKSMAKSMGIKGYSKLRKTDLINTIVSSPQYQRTITRPKSRSPQRTITRPKSRSPQRTITRPKSRSPQQTQFTDLPPDMFGVICNQSSIKDLRNIIDTNRALRDACTPILKEKINKLQISAGFNHSLALDENGNVWSCGYNPYGGLGLGDYSNRNIFTKTNLGNIKQISGGKYYSLALDNNGNVWSCGFNRYGQLGLGNYVNKNIFTKTNLGNIKQISAGGNHSLALDNSGNVWSCGNNMSGQSGLGYNNDNTNVFKQIPNLTNIKQISVGEEYSLALDNKGNVWSCGDNPYGQLGLGNNNNSDVFTQTKLRNVIQISAGGKHSLALDNNGNVWSCGFNGYGQLGLGNNDDNTNLFKQTSFVREEVARQLPLTNIIQISAGGYHSLALDNNGNIWSCGFNEFGQLGLKDNENRYLFKKTKINNIVKISAGNDYSLSINNDENVLSCGLNFKGQLGIGNNSKKNIFTKTNIF